MSSDSMIPSGEYRVFGVSPETESSWPEALGEVHRDFILAYIEQAQAMEEAAISQLLERCP